MVTVQPLSTFEEPFPLSVPHVVSHFPRTYISCTGGGRLVSFLRQLISPRALPPKDPGCRLRQLPTGHDAIITMPRELAALHLDIVRDRSMNAAHRFVALVVGMLLATARVPSSRARRGSAGGVFRSRASIGGERPS